MLVPRAKVVSDLSQLESILNLLYSRRNCLYIGSNEREVMKHLSTVSKAFCAFYRVMEVVEGHHGKG